MKTWLSNAEGADSIPGWGDKIPHASWPKSQNIKQKRYCNKFNKNFKNGPQQQKSFLKKYNGREKSNFLINRIGELQVFG